jgi:transcriptional regulator with XRE-family HTH domain
VAKAAKASSERFPLRKSAALKALAFNVWKLRKARGWSQGDLAAEAGLTQDVISLIENGRANPTVLTVEQIAATYGMTLQDLFEPRARPQRPKDK